MGGRISLYSSFQGSSPLFPTLFSAVGTQALKNQAVPVNLKPCLFFDLPVILCVVGQGSVKNPAASRAENMIVAVTAGVIPVRRRHLDICDLLIFGEDSKIAVYRSPADFAVYGAHIQINLVGGRMVASCFYRV